MNDNMSQKYNMITDDSVIKVSIEKSCYNDKSHYYIGFCLDQGLS